MRGWNQKPKDLKERDINEEKENPVDGRKYKCHYTGNPNKEEQGQWTIEGGGMVNDPKLRFQTSFKILKLV